MSQQQQQQFPLLRLFLVDNELRKSYEEAVQKHNNHVRTDPYPNSGFDLFMPSVIFPTDEPGHVLLISQGVKAEMVDRDGGPSAFYLYPRSSISKTPLMMANHVGIIDSGYRGEVIAAVRNMAIDDYKIEGGTRLFQICAPDLKPFLVEIVDQLSNTERGAGGFGSTGK